MRRLLFILAPLFALIYSLSDSGALAAEPRGRFAPPSDTPGGVSSSPRTWYFHWDHNLQSAEQRPIETVQIGQGAFRTLVVGSLHGSEPMARAVVKRLAEHLGNQPNHWHQLNALVVKTPNPDGFARGSSLSARGVDLNRNFPTGYGATRDSRSGSSAASEIETRALQHLLETFRPHRVVHVKSTRNRIGWALCNRRARAASAFLSQIRNLRVGRLEDHLVPGSLEHYASHTLGLETITLAVPHAPDPASVWEECRNALLASTAYVDPAFRPASRYARFGTGLPTVSSSEPLRLPWLRTRAGSLSNQPGSPRER